MATVVGNGNLSKSDKFAPSSTFLEAVEYNPKEKTMDITFRNGTRIRYTDVGLPTFQAFKSSPTHSAYYARAIKGNLSSVKLIDNSIGRNSSTPLKHVREEKTLDQGLRRQESRKRKFGTVPAALAA